MAVKITTQLRLAAGLALLALWLAASPVLAQSSGDYGKILGGDSEETTSTPLRSLPAGAADDTSGTSSTPTAADYTRVAETSTGEPMLSRTRQAVTLFRERLRSMIQRMPQAWEKIEAALAAASPTGKPSYFIGVAVFAALLLIIGRAITMTFMVYIVRRILIGMQQTERHGYRGKLPVLANRFIFTAVGVAITVGVAASVGLFFYQEHEATLVTVVTVFATYATILVIDTIWRMAIAPYFSEYRLPQIPDDKARNLYRWLSATSVFAILSMAFGFWMQALGLAAEVHTTLIVCLSLITVILAVVLIQRHRSTISGAILAGRKREEASWLTLAATTLWAPLVTLYLLFTWADLSFRLIMGIESSPLRLAAPYGIFMAGLIVYAIASYLIERIFTRTREIQVINAELEARRAAEEAAEAERMRELASHSAADTDGDTDGDGDEGAPPQASEDDFKPVHARRRHSMTTLEDLARRTASLFAIGAVAYALVRFWGGPGVFERIPGLDIAEDLIDTLLIGYILYHAIRIWIDQKIAEEIGDEEDGGPMEGEGGGAGATRLATLLPLFRNFLLISIVVGTALWVAVEMGVNVAPLFAGAGIVGLAIGFGSQALVRDILSGAFFLMDDAFRKGEYIDAGDVKGTVEKISLRSFQLRHHLGMLHTIPFGEIGFLTNFSRDWVMMKLPLRLTYDTDVERVRKLVKKLGLRLLEDPEIGEKFIQPVKSQGVIQMDDSAMIVRIKFMTRPGEQWVLRKRIYAEIRELFEKEGIKFAHREVTVRVPGLEDHKGDLSEDQIKAIGAGAKRAIDQADEELVSAGGKQPV